MRNPKYNRIKKKAEQGEPLAMIKLAKLYKAGVFGDDHDELYAYWLRAFFKTPIVDRTVAEYEDEDDSPENELLPYNFAGDILRGDIIDAGVALALYYCKSSNPKELRIAMKAIDAAMCASKWDPNYDAGGSNINLMDILTDIYARLESCVSEEGENHE